MATGQKKTNRLGKGLSSLMATPVSVVPASPPEVSAPSESTVPPKVSQPTEKVTTPEPPTTDVPRGTPADDGGLVHLPIDTLHPNPRQPRQAFAPEALQQLADSIQTHGMMQPVVVRPTRRGGYEIVAGERRWRAAKLAGLTALPALIREIDNRQSAEWALVENLQREDLNPIERAEAFHQLAEEFGQAHDQIARQVGLNRSTVTNLLRLLKLDAGVRQLVADDLLSMGHARALAGVANGPVQLSLAERCVREGWSVRQMEAAIRQQADTPKTSLGKPVSPAKKSAWIADLERQVAEQLGTKVVIKPGRKKGAGTVSIDYHSLDAFDALLDRLGVKAG